MKRRNATAGALVALACLLGHGGCGPDRGATAPDAPGAEPSGAAASAAAADGPIQMGEVSAQVGEPDPDGAYWAQAPVRAVALLAQPMVAPRPERATTDRVELQAVHDGTHAAFRLRWRDPDRSEAGPLGAYSDAAALQFAVNAYGETSVFMGTEDNPVHILHWRAQYQRDLEHGKPEMPDLYPHINMDMYPLEFPDAPSASLAEREKFSPGIAEGNPQAYQKTAVDEIVAHGFATSSVQENSGARAKGAWADGAWTLVITRPLEVDGGSSLLVPDRAALAVAIWQGGEDEVGSRKCVTMSWIPIEVKR